MKNTIVLFLLATYLFSTTNWNIGVHKCAGEKSYSIFGYHLNFKCECDHSDKEHQNCCSDDEIQLKANNSDKLVKKEVSNKKMNFEFVPAQIQILFQFKSIFHYLGILSYELPTGHSPPLIILFQVFRI